MSQFANLPCLSGSHSPLQVLYTVLRDHHSLISRDTFRMTHPRYNIVFQGRIVDGFDRAEVQTTFARTFAMTRERAAEVFRRPATTLKSNLDAATAKRYQDRLARMGLQVEAIERTQTDTRSAAPRPTDHTGLSLVPTEADDTPGDSGHTGGAGTGGTRAHQREQERPMARVSPFYFHGNGGEYFGIWIVNILLSILTLGIYSAWAKVRNKRYFYGNTELEGSRFEYTADPVRILIGRAVALVFFIAYSAMLEMTLTTAVLAWLLFMAFMPWAVRQSLRFKARYSRYRNVPFQFQGSLTDAFIVFIAWPIIALLTLGVLLPMALQRQQAYILGNHCFGTRPFHFDAPVRAYYKMALVMIIAVLIMGALAFLFSAMVFTIVLVPLVLVSLYLLLFAMFGVYMANLKFNHTTLARHRFEANWAVGSYFRLVLVNSLLTVITLGLFTPWAKVRAARYAAEHTEAIIMGDLDNFTAAESEKTSTIAEGVGDLFDLDIGA